MSRFLFEDEMTEEHVARTEDDYQRVTRQEIHDGLMDEARALTGAVLSLSDAMMEARK